MKQILGIILILFSGFLIWNLREKMNKKITIKDHSSISEERVNEHLFLTNEQLNLQKEKVKLMQNSNLKSQGSTYEIHDENTTGVDMTSDQRPENLVNELGRNKKLEEINNPQAEIHDQLLELQKSEREQEKKKIQELEVLKKTRKSGKH